MDTFGPNNLVRTGLLVKENFYDAARMHRGESTPSSLGFFRAVSGPWVQIFVCSHTSFDLGVLLL